MLVCIRSMHLPLWELGSMRSNLRSPQKLVCLSCAANRHADFSRDRLSNAIAAIYNAEQEYLRSKEHIVNEIKQRFTMPIQGMISIKALVYVQTEIEPRAITSR